MGSIFFKQKLLNHLDNITKIHTYTQYGFLWQNPHGWLRFQKPVYSSMCDRERGERTSPCQEVIYKIRKTRCIFLSFLVLKPFAKNHTMENNLIYRYYTKCMATLTLKSDNAIYRGIMKITIHWVQSMSIAKSLAGHRHTRVVRCALTTWPHTKLSFSRWVHKHAQLDKSTIHIYAMEGGGVESHYKHLQSHLSREQKMVCKSQQEWSLFSLDLLAEGLWHLQ